MTLAALQGRFHGAVTYAEEAAEADWNDAQRRGLAIYRNAYRARLIETLRASYEKTWSWIGDESFDAAAIHHVIARPPASWTLDDAADGFAETLALLFPFDREIAELAALEWDMAQAFVSADASHISATEFARATSAYGDKDWAAMRLEFIPGLVLRRVATNCAAIWHSIGNGDEMPQDTQLPAPATLAIWRRGLQPCFRTLESDEAEGIALLQGGADFGALCLALIEQHGDNDGVLRAGGFVSQWITDQIVVSLCPNTLP